MKCKEYSSFSVLCIDCKYPSDISCCRDLSDGIFKDEVGGIHDQGIGWNPQGVYCGECGNLTCKNCVNEKIEKGIDKSES